MKWLLYLFIGILASASGFSQLYGDVTFEVQDTGEVIMSGETNYEPFKGTTQTLTSKEGIYWLLNISSPMFDDYIYHVTLPEGASINHIKSNGQLRIEDTDDSLTITGTGSDKNLELVIQYSIVNKKQTSYLYGILAIVLISSVTIFLTMRYTNKHKKERQSSAEQTQESKQKKALDRKRFTERQLQIIDYIQKKGTVTQAELEKALQLPKSSLSRNIETLVQKKVLFKETKGMSNVVGFED